MKAPSGANELWVRIFPDDISIQTHEKELTADEIAAGQTYWTKVWEGRKLQGRELENATKGAWNVIVNRYGANRASWIRVRTKPVNWDHNPEQLSFPDLKEKVSAWTQGPRAVLLPERFVVMGYNRVGGELTEVIRAEGSFVPDHLIVGPDPLVEESSFARNADGSVRVSGDMAWLIDFDKAVEVGMGLKIPITQPQAISGFERLVVLGIRISSDEQSNKKLLETLFENHHYTKGMGILPQGTPTNNMDGQQGGFSSLDSANENSFENEVNQTDFEIMADPELKPDGQRLAEALGIDARALFPIENYHFSDITEAMAMNRALWNVTMGGFMEEMMGGLVSRTAMNGTKDFFQKNVAGRGHIPVIRVGKQPYGILATSAFTPKKGADRGVSRWQWNAQERSEGDALPEIQSILDQLAKVWSGRSDQVMHSGDANEPFITLLNILGLQAQSVEFHSRMAAADEVSLNYLAFQGTPGKSYFPGWQRMLNEKSRQFFGIGLDLTHDPEKLNLKDLTFFGESPLLNGPVIDQEPLFPLSELDGLRVNYIEWLLNNNEKSQILAGKFFNSDGEVIPEPNALLYKLLKQAYLKSLSKAGHDLVIAKEPAIGKIQFAETPVVNMGQASRRIAREDLLSIDASKLQLGNEQKPLGDFILRDLLSPVQSLDLSWLESIQEVRNAMGILTHVPTARLERLFAEHLDLCGYRLDAWQTGMAQRRLFHLRNADANNTEHVSGGLHIGAFSWIEHLKPELATREEITGAEKQQISDILGNPIPGELYESRENAGYMMAPSLGQAVTAAVLRNAYLTHADDAHKNTMAVNLSSERVRTALFYFDGLKNGQEIGALLGYQFERGLHERYPALALDEYIYIFRSKFPLLAGKLTKIEDGASAEVIEARNVVNGYDLLTFIQGKQYPFGLSGLPADDPVDAVVFKKAEAIKSEINDLSDALDAIGDLSLAESVYQVVEGNYDRARGILQSVTEGKNPPDIQLTNTPRSGQSLTHRVVISFDPAEIEGWHASLTPRASANKLLNAWLKKVLPAPEMIQWSVTDQSGTTMVSVKDLNLEPTDVVLMTGDSIGDNSSDLERFLVNHYRRTHLIADDVVNFFFVRDNADVPASQSLIFHPDSAEPGKISLSEIWFVLKSLKAVIGKSRPLNAQDLILPSEGQNLTVPDRQGYFAVDRPELKDLKDIYERLVTAHAAFDGHVAPLKTLYDITLKPLYDLLIADENRILDAAWDAHLVQIRALLSPLVLFGMPEAMPASWENSGLPPAKFEKIQTLVRQVEVVLKMADKKLSRIHTENLLAPLALPADAKKHQESINLKLLQLTEAARQILGESFVLIPLFRLFNSSALKAAIDNASNMASSFEVGEWLESVGRVRPAIQDLVHFTGLSELLTSTETLFKVSQLPFKAGEKWVGLPFGDMVLDKEYLSLALNQAPQDTHALQAGLLLDEWTELIPTEKETMGIAFHYNRPNTVAPQSLLLAVSPDLTGSWTWDDLSSIVNETLDRAKIRAVEPDMILDTDYAAVFPTVLQSFTRSKSIFSTLFANINLEKIQTP